MKVRELLGKKTQSVVTIQRDEVVRTAARLLMERGIGGLPVLARDGSVCGFVAERDIVRAAHERGEDFRGHRVEEIMHRPAPTCDAEAPLQEVMSRMTRERERHLVVLEGGRVAGVISVGDLVKHRLEQLETEAGVLRDYVTARRALS
jgi:CBS domain-containing protein